MFLFSFVVLIFCLFVCLFVFLRQFLCSPGSPGADCVDQDGSELKKIVLPLLQSAGIKGVRHHCWPNNQFL